MIFFISFSALDELFFSSFKIRYPVFSPKRDWQADRHPPTSQLVSLFFHQRLHYCISVCLSLTTQLLKADGCPSRGRVCCKVSAFVKAVLPDHRLVLSHGECLVYAIFRLISVINNNNALIFYGLFPTSQVAQRCLTTITLFIPPGGGRLHV